MFVGFVVSPYCSFFHYAIKNREYHFCLLNGLVHEISVRCYLNALITSSKVFAGYSLSSADFFLAFNQMFRKGIVLRRKVHKILLLYAYFFCFCFERKENNRVLFLTYFSNEPQLLDTSV